MGRRWGDIPKTCVYHHRSGTPVFMDLEATGARRALFLQWPLFTVVALACETEVERQLIASLKHLTNVVLARSARCSICASTVPPLAGSLR